MTCQHKPFCGNCERSLVECRDDPCSQTMPVCRTCFAHLDKPAAGTFAVFQDGPQFYIGDDESTFYTISAPMVVRDMDCDAAEIARAWFVGEWAPTHGVVPIFEGEAL